MFGKEVRMARTSAGIPTLSRCNLIPAVVRCPLLNARRREVVLLKVV